jgi:lipoprotein-releasing system permease protein
MGHGLLLGLVGVAIGAVIGIAVATHVTEIALLLEHWLGVRLFDPAVYYIGVLPSDLQWSDVLFTIAIAMLLSGLAALYPAWRAARIEPAEVLNHV